MSSSKPSPWICAGFSLWAGGMIESANMRAPRKRKAMACAFLFCALLLSACESRKKSSTESFPDSRISVEEVTEPVQGDLSALQPYVPRQYSVTPFISRPASGQGFIVRLKLSYSAPDGVSLDYWTLFWRIEAYSGNDPSNLTKLQLPAQDYYVENLEWLMPVPIQNAYYVLELSGVVSNRSTGRWVEGTVRLARIKLDLRGLQ